MGDMTKKNPYLSKKWKLAIEAAFPDSAPPNIVMTGEENIKAAQEMLRRAIEEKFNEDAKAEAAMKAAMQRGYRLGLTKEQAEQLVSGKIPPMPGDELPISEWMRRRDGRSTKAEEEAKQKREEKEKADLLAKIAVQQFPDGFTASFSYDLGSIGYMGGGGIGISPRESVPQKPNPPEKTTEQAQKELTGLGRRKIIVSGGENNT